MPRAEWMTDRDFEKFERCVEDLKRKQGDKKINIYAVCRAAIKKGKKRNVAHEWKGNSQ